MKKYIRYSPTLLAAVFLLLTVGRVSAFLQEQMAATPFSANLFAAGLIVGVLISSYFNQKHHTWKETKTGKTKESKASQATRKTASWLMWAFIIADGIFNLAEVNRNLPDETTLKNATVIYLAAQFFGIWPTVAASLLAQLQSHVDKLPNKVFGIKKGSQNNNDVIASIAYGLKRAQQFATSQNGAQPVRRKSQPGKTKTQKGKHRCDYCRKTFEKPQGLSGHLKSCKKYQAAKDKKNTT